MAGPQNPGAPPDPPLDPEIKATLARAFIVPAPPFNKNVSVPINKEERLRTIIKNIESHNEKVRANIISSPPPPSATAPSPPLTPRSRDALLARQDRINASLIASLSTPWDPATDSPAIKPSPPYRAPAQTQNSSSGGAAPRQLPLPVANAYHKMRALDAYDAHAKKSLQYYRSALERWGSAAGVGSGGAAGGERRPSDGGMSTAAGEKRASDFGVGEMGSTGDSGGRRSSDVAMGGMGVEGMVNVAGQAPVAAMGQGQGQGGTYDKARDPRLKR